MISPFIEQAEPDIGLFTFYKSQDSQSPPSRTLNHPSPANTQPQIQPNPKTKYLQRSCRPLLCEKFLKDIKLKKQGNTHSNLPEEEKKAVGQQRPPRMIEDLSQITLDKNSTSRRPEENVSKAASPYDSIQAAFNSRSLHDSVSAIRKKYFRNGSSIPGQRILKVKSKFQSEPLQSQLCSPDRTTGSDQNPRELFQFRKKIPKKTSFREGPVELSFQNQVYFKKMMNKMESDQSLCNKIFRQSWKMPQITHRLKTDAHSSQSAKLKPQQGLQAFNLSRMAYMERQGRSGNERQGGGDGWTLVRFNSQK